MGDHVLLVHSVHFAEDFALIHWQNCAVVPDLLKHSTTLKLIAGPFEEVSETENMHGQQIADSAHKCTDHGYAFNTLASHL